MNKKAIRIDLSTFFDDERRMTCVLIDPSWTSVECLQKRIEFLFDVDSVRFLSDGYFLPPQESIEIIKFCNDLKAFVPKESLEKRKKKKSKKCKNEESQNDEGEDENTTVHQADEQQEPIDDSQMKRKANSCYPSSTISNKAKRSKNSYTFSEITSTSEQLPAPPVVLAEDDDGSKSKRSKAKKSKAESLLENKSVTENLSHVEENTLVCNSSDNGDRNRRTSTPKDKKSCDFEELRKEKTFNDEAKPTSARPSSIPSSTFLNESKMSAKRNNANTPTASPNLNNPFKKPKISKAHIYFNDSGEEVNPKTVKATKLTTQKSKEPKTIVIFRCPLDDVTNSTTKPQKPRIFHLKSTNIADDKTKKQLVEIQEEIILSPINIEKATQNSGTEEKSLVDKMEKQQATIETSKVADELDSLNENSSLNNTSNATGSTTIAKNVNEEQSIDELEVSRKESTTIAKSVDEEQSIDELEEVTHNETTNVTLLQNESQMQQTNVNESSIMSVDCVDLSIDLDDDDIETHKKKTMSAKFKKLNAQEKHDLTVDEDLSSDVEEISEIIDLNETEDNCDNTVNTSTKVPVNTINDIKIDNILPFSTDLNDLPNIDDILIFKVPYTNKKQQLVHTNYLAGKVEYINRRTKSIKLLIIDGNKELSYVPNQFLCNLDDSQDCIKYLQLKLNDMFEPKLFSMT